MRKAIILIIVLLPILMDAQNSLFIPDTVSGSEMDLKLQEGMIEFFPGVMTNTIGYNQDILGPTIILNKGTDVTLNVTNALEDPSTLHWHGLHVSAKNDGGPHTVIQPGEVWSPSFTVLDHAATYWYHPHLHEHTEEQVTLGAAGFIIVRDDFEKELDLPRTYGVDDIPVVIQSRSFDDDKQLQMNAASDDLVLCNGTIDPQIDLPAQVIRLRLLNGSTERTFLLGFENNRTFYQIGTDGGLLDHPVLLERLRLVPGERAEILLDLSNDQDAHLALQSFGSELPNGIYGASSPGVIPFNPITGYNDNPLNGNDFSILDINVIPATANPLTEIPSTLIENNPYDIQSVNEERTLFFQPSQMGPVGMVNGPFLINGESFDFDHINYEILLGNVEVWELFNMTAISHPFHIHDVQFYILEINGNPPPENELGRKDVVLVSPMGGNVKFITRFDDFADDETPYMYHCHMLSHEDEGMMGQFVVLGNTTDVQSIVQEEIEVFPNPVSDHLNIISSSPFSLALLNAGGSVVELSAHEGGQTMLDMSDLPSGFYTLQINTKESSFIKKIIHHSSN